jgi:hypothetical protein
MTTTEEFKHRVEKTAAEPDESEIEVSVEETDKPAEGAGKA